MLLADGTHKPINEIEPGDLVVGYDTDSGAFGSHQVLDQWSHHDDGDMVTVTLEDGTSVSATDDHLFWLADDRTWVEAEDLQAGDQLLDADGTTETVTNVDVYTPSGGGVVNDAQNEAFDEIVNGTIGPQMSTLPLNGGQ